MRWFESPTFFNAMVSGFAHCLSFCCAEGLPDPKIILCAK